MRFLIAYLLITLLVGVIVKLLCVVARVDVGMLYERKYWNNGYVTEACKTLLNYLFDQGYEKIRIDAVVENIGSNKVIQKCGGKLINTIDDFVQMKNKSFKINQYEVYKN